jgi:hypothetical protein
LTQEISSLERFSELGLLNDQGKPRLNLAQYHFSHGIDLELLTDLYRYWRDQAEYGVIEKSWFEDLSIKHEYKAVKCSKRGNDVYRYRIKERIGWMDKIPNLTFFNEKDLGSNQAYTRMLFFTLTYDTKRCSRIEAWENVGLEYNRWISRVRRAYGKVSAFRVWQTFQKGYPHVHGVILFNDHKFKVFRHTDVDGEISYRVEEKGDLQTSWHSFVDVVAVRTVQGALRYCKRYIARKNIDVAHVSHARTIQANGSVSDLDMALMWLFRKRSFAVSGEFREALSDLIRVMHNSNAKSMVQMALDGSKAEELEVWYRWLGVFGALELGITHNEWFKFLEFDPSAS